MMLPSGDLVLVVLHDGYGSSLDWEIWRTLRRNDSAFMSSLQPSFMLMQRFFHPQLGMGRPSSSGMMTGRDTADCARCSLVSIHYPWIQGFRCGRPGTTPGFWLCPRHWPTRGWLSCLVYRTSLPTDAH